MASGTALTVLYGFAALFICSLQLRGAATNIQQASTRGLIERVATTAFVPSVLATLVLAPLLLYAHVRALTRGVAAAGGGRRLVAGLAKVTVLAATVALLAVAVLQLRAVDGAVVQIGADGHLDRGRGDVARLNIK